MARPNPTQSTQAPLHWDPLVVVDDPYPTYRRLRDEAPLYRDVERGIWALSRFEDVQAAARDWLAMSMLGEESQSAVRAFLERKK